MPTPTTAKWPKPKSEDEFEDISVDFARLRWQDPHATRNGRRGQRQHGVDIVGRPPWADGNVAGAQCKNVEELTLSDVIAIAREAKPFPGGLHELLVIVAADRDSPLQNAVREHFPKQPTPFRVEVVFWQDITAEVTRDTTLIAKHWHGFAPARAGSLPVNGDSESLTRSSLKLIRDEAKRMKAHSEQLVPAIYGGSWEHFIADKFLPADINEAAKHVRDAVAPYVSLANALDTLRATSAAADTEAERILDSRASSLDQVLALAMRVGSAAHAVADGIERLFPYTKT